MDIFSKPIAVIADIHGNNDALLAVLRDIDTHGIETILNLGDHLSGPLAAADTMAAILSRRMIHIRGNHDRYLIEQTRASMGASDQAAYDQLSPDHLSWLRGLPATRTLDDEIFMCHGTPESDETYWFESVLPSGDVIFRDQAGIEAYAQGVTTPLILCAHTHIPRAVRLMDGRLIVNPGSVGLSAYDDELPYPHVMQTGSPDARYAVVQKQSGTWRVTFHAVPYDPSGMSDRAAKAHRLGWVNALSTGWLAGHQ